MKLTRNLIKKTFLLIYYILFHPITSWKVFSSRTKRRIIRVTAVILIVAISIPASLWYQKYRANVAEAAWWNDLWLYRKAITISNTSGSELTDFQVKILVDKDLSSDISAGKIQADLDDLRFTDLNGNNLPYWIEDTTGSSVDVWIKAPRIPTTGATFYMYYGNTQATATSDGNKTFEFFDDFSGSSLDTDKWTKTDSGGYLTQSGGEMVISNGPSSWGSTALFSNKSFIRDNYDFYYKFRPTCTVGASYHVTTMMGWKDNGSGTSYADMPYASYWYKTTGASNITLTVYEDGNSRGSANTSLSCNAQYYGKVKMKASGGATYFVSSDGTNWTQNYDSTYSTESSLKVGFTQYQGGISYFDNAFVKKSASAEPTAGTPASEEKGTAPIEYWSLDDGTGTTAQDGTSNNKDLTLTNMASTSDPDSGWQPADKCVSGKCLAFDGTNDFVTTSSSVTLGGTTSGGSSVFMWVKHNGSSNIFAVGDWYNRLFNNNWTIVDSNNVYHYLDLGNVGDGRWHYVGYTLSGRVMKSYKDGVLMETETADYDIPSRAGNITVGRLSSGTGPWYYKGYADEPKIYDYARTATQVKNDYNAGMAGIGKASEGTEASAGAKSPSWLTQGLMGYWKMDEASWNGTSGEVKDASGNSNNGTAVSGATTVAGKFGNGGTFDGADDTVTVPAITGNSTTQTFSAWVYVRGAVSGNQYIVDQGSNNNSISVYSNHFRIITSASYIYDSVTTPTANRWYFITKVFDGNKLYLYIDGNLDGSMTASGYTPSSITFGNYGGGGAYRLNGIIDEARLYNRALSPQEIQQLYNYAPGPVGYWNMDEASGATAKDLSGNGNNGTLASGATWANGKYGGAASFDGVNNTFSATLSGITLDNYSLEYWVKPTSSNTQTGEIIAMRVGGTSFYVSTGSNTYRVVDPSLNITTPSTGAVGTSSYSDLLNRWTHITVTRDSDDVVRIYKNGVLQTSAPGNSATASNPVLQIGGIFSGRDLIGQIDDVKVYNYARTAKQITEDMNASHPAGGSPVGSQAAYWKFDEGQGTTAYDSGPSHNNGTLTCSYTSCAIPQWKNDAKFGKSLFFNTPVSSTSYVTASSINATAGNSITISMWLKPDASQTNGGWFIRNGTGADENYGFYLNGVSGGKYRLSFEGYDTNFRTASTSSYFIPASSWNQLTVIYNYGVGFNIYLNGQFIETVNYAYSTQPSVSSFNIGGHAGSSAQTFSGYIDEVKVYNYALSADDIKIDYNQGKSMVLGSAGTASDGKTMDFSAARGYCPPGNTEGNCAAGQNPTPVGEWRLDEGTGTPTKDTSGNGNDGTLTNGPTWVPGKYNNAVNFDGSNDSVNVSSSSSLNITTATVEGWFYPTAISGGVAMSTGGSWTDQRLVLHFGYPANNKIKFTVSNGTNYETLTGLTDLPLNTWSHVVATADGSTLKIYLNGRLDNSTTQHYTPSLSSVPLYIGMTQGLSPNNFTGKIDDVKLFGYARTAAQVAWDYNRGKPAAWWKFDEGQGSTAYDATGSGNNGTLNNMDPPTDWVAGKNNGALDFDGSNDYVEMTSSYSLPMNSFSTTGWIKTSASDDDKVLSLSVNYHPIQTLYGKLRICVNGCSVGTTTINDGNWHFVSVVGDGTSIRAYLDGKSTPEITQTASSTTMTGIPRIGAVGKGSGSDSPSLYYNGQADDIRIFYYALSAEQVKQVMNEGGVNFR